MNDEPQQLLREKSPFAHKAVVRSLSHFQTGKDAQMPQTNTPGLAFIAGPIQDLFRQYPANLASTLKTLSVVAIRFQKAYIHVPNVDWQKKLDTRVPFLDDMLAAHSAKELARSLARADESMFSQLKDRNQLTNELRANQSTVIESIHTRWCNLAEAVWECCTALPDHVPWVQECIEVGFHDMSSVYLNQVTNSQCTRFCTTCKITTPR